MARYVWQNENWPHLTWRARELEGELSRAAFCEGCFLGRLAGIGFALQDQAGLETLSDEIVCSAAIEGESLNRVDVRSSVARRMEIVLPEDSGRRSHELDARTEMMMDATRGWDRPMTKERLLSWHAALFPTGYSGLSKVKVAAFRDESEGPMQVVSRHGSLLRVHFEAPPADRLDAEVESFLKELNADSDEPLLIRVAVAHLRFLTLHPFEDGNGRLARALTEWMLARGERTARRFYSLSAQIQQEKDAYYDELEHAQRNSLDVTRWIVWFLQCHRRAVASAQVRLETILAKARFWQTRGALEFTVHQREMLNRLFDGFEGNLTSSKWAKMCKVSQDTASREIADLVSRGLLRKVGSGRSTYYVLVSETES